MTAREAVDFLNAWGETELKKASSQTTIQLDPLVERIAQELHRRSLERDGLTDAHKTWDEQWATAKELYARDPSYYTRPAHAIADAEFAVSEIRRALS
jgi:hypothetical protein